MNFLEAVKQYVETRSNPHEIIFDTVNRVFDNKKFILKQSSSNIERLEIELEKKLDEFWNTRLESLKESKFENQDSQFYGFVLISRQSTNDDALKTLNFLLNQFMSESDLKGNPQLKTLKSDLKKICKDLDTILKITFLKNSNSFLKAKINILVDYNKASELIETFKFSEKEVVNWRLKQHAIRLIGYFSEKETHLISTIFNDLKKQLGITGNLNEDFDDNSYETSNNEEFIDYSQVSKFEPQPIYAREPENSDKFDSLIDIENAQKYILKTNPERRIHIFCAYCLKYSIEKNKQILDDELSKMFRISKSTLKEEIKKFKDSIKNLPKLKDFEHLTGDDLIKLEASIYNYFHQVQRGN